MFYSCLIASGLLVFFASSFSLAEDRVHPLQQFLTERAGVQQQESPTSLSDIQNRSSEVLETRDYDKKHLSALRRGDYRHIPNEVQLKMKSDLWQSRKFKESYACGVVFAPPRRDHSLIDSAGLRMSLARVTRSLPADLAALSALEPYRSSSKRPAVFLNTTMPFESFDDLFTVELIYFAELKKKNDPQNRMAKVRRTPEFTLAAARGELAPAQLQHLVQQFVFAFKDESSDVEMMYDATTLKTIRNFLPIYAAHAYGWNPLRIKEFRNQIASIVKAKGFRFSEDNLNLITKLAIVGEVSAGRIVSYYESLVRASGADPVQLMSITEIDPYLENLKTVVLAASTHDQIQKNIDTLSKIKHQITTLGIVQIWPHLLRVAFLNNTDINQVLRDYLRFLGELGKRSRSPSQNLVSVQTFSDPQDKVKLWTMMQVHGLSFDQIEMRVKFLKESKLQSRHDSILSGSLYIEFLHVIFGTPLIHIL